MKFKKISEDSYELEFNGVSKKDFLCQDIYLIGTLSDLHIVMLTKNYHKLVVKNVTPEMWRSIGSFGIHILKICDKLSNLVPDLLMTVGLYLGGLGSNPKIPFFGSHPT